MRQDGDDEETIPCRHALEELRVYQVSQESWKLLNSRVQNELTLDELKSLMTRYVFTSVERRFASTITSASATANSLSSKSSLHIQAEGQRGQTMTRLMDWILSFASV